MPEGMGRSPKVSAIVLSFNQKDYIVAALESVLDQTLPVQVVVCDDCSTDGTGRLARDVLERAGWPNGSILIENDCNYGVSRTLQTAFSRATGDIIMINDGDDISAPGRAARVVEALSSSGNALVGSAVEPISLEGEALKTPCFWIVDADKSVEIGEVDVYGRWCVLGATMAFRRSVMERFGPLPAAVKMCDKALTHRALALGGIGLISEPLVRYRFHVGGQSSWLTAWSVNRRLLRRKLSDYVANSGGLRGDLKRVMVEATGEERKKLRVIESSLETEERMLRAVLAFPSLESALSLMRGLRGGDQYWRRFALRCLFLAVDPPRHEMWLRRSGKEIRARIAGRLRRRLWTRSGRG